MELASKLKWTFIVFTLLFALIIAGWGLSYVARGVFDTGVSNNSEQNVKGTSIDDVDIVRFKNDGPVVASREHRSYIITVSRHVVSMKLYSDYGQKVIKEKNYVNNAEAYEALVRALDKADATSRIKNTDSDDDYNEQGACPEGNRYILELGDIERRWSTSCSSVKGTAGGEMTIIRKLFNKQIPDYADLVEDTKLKR